MQFQVQGEVLTFVVLPTVTLILGTVLLWPRRQGTMRVSGKDESEWLVGMSQKSRSNSTSCSQSSSLGGRTIRSRFAAAGASLGRR